MDIRTGHTYATLEEAMADGVPASDIAEVEPQPTGPPKVKFSKHPFGRFKNAPDTDAQSKPPSQKAVV